MAQQSAHPQSSAVSPGSSDEFVQLCSHKRETLYLKEGDSTGELDPLLPYTILSSLYRRNEAIARATLYKDHANDYSRRPEKWNQLSIDIEKYEDARRSRLALREYGRHDFDESESDLVRLAAHLAAIENVEQADGEDDLRKTISAAMVDRAKADLSTSITALFGNDHRSEYAAEIKARKEAVGKALISRLVFGIFGGLTLIAPVIIMTLVGSYVILTTLLTISLFTLYVAVILAVTMRTAESKDIVFATSAYTAVLVIFLGNSSIIQGHDGTCLNSATQEESLCFDSNTTAGVVVGVIVATVVLIGVVAAVAISLRGYAPSGGLLSMIGLSSKKLPSSRKRSGKKGPAKNEQTVV